MKTLFISSMAFDACLSIVKRLQTKTDLYYMFEVKPYKPNLVSFSENSHKDIILGTEVKELQTFANYLPLDRTYMVVSCPLKNIIQHIRKQINVYKQIKRINPEIIHCFNELHPIFFLFLLLNRKKIVLTVHDPIQHSGENTLMKWIIRKISFLAIKKHILLNNAQYEEYLVKYSKRRRDVYLSSLSIYEFLQDYTEPQKKQSTFNILFFGRISPYKGIEYLLQAFVKLQKEGVKNISLTIAGKGDFSFDIAEYKSNADITFINRFVPNAELVKLINNSNVVVCPYTDATQSGVVMSAFALHKPIIATNTGGLPEMVENEVTGLIIPPKEADAIKNAILKIQEDESLLKNMSENIKRQYEFGEKSWNSVVEKLVEIYKDL